MSTLTKTLMAVVVAGFMMTSCGSKSAVCECADTLLSMTKEMKDVKLTDAEKMKEIQAKYKDKVEAKCEKIGEGKTEEEKKKMEAELKECSSYKEMDKMMKEEEKGAE
jgi:hypothetical protein